METLVGWVIVLALGYWWYQRRKKRKAVTSDSSTNTGSRGAAWATGSGGDSALKSGREKLPGKKWVCTRCGREFSISVDPKNVPRMWWIPPNNQWKSGETAPWACPDCGTYAYTVPIG
jgi:rubrerythrin